MSDTASPIVESPWDSLAGGATKCSDGTAADDMNMVLGDDP